MIQTETTSIQLTRFGIPIRNLWHMLLYVWDLVHLNSHWKSDVENSPTLDALLANILGNLIQQRLRSGLGRDYRSHASEISCVRGRVNFTESLKRMSFHQGRAYCHFDRFSANIPRNQIVRSTLARLVQCGEFGNSVSEGNVIRTRLRRLARDMHAVDFVELQAASIRREQLQTHDQDYRLMLAICYLLNQRQMPTEDVGIAGLPVLDRDAFTLYAIYEQFVAKFYSHHLNDWSVVPQQKLVWPTDSASIYLPAMYPDLTLQHKASGHIIVLDTKFTAKILVSGRWGKQTFNRDHFFQIYAYLKSQEHRSEKHKTSTGILLYPTVDHELSEAIMIQGHSLCWETVDLSMQWEWIEKQLLAIPAKVISKLGQ